MMGCLGERGDICKHSVELALSPGVICASINHLFKLNNEGWGLTGEIAFPVTVVSEIEVNAQTKTRKQGQRQEGGSTSAPSEQQLWSFSMDETFDYMQKSMDSMVTSLNGGEKALNPSGPDTFKPAWISTETPPNNRIPSFLETVAAPRHSVKVIYFNRLRK